MMMRLGIDIFNITYGLELPEIEVLRDTTEVLDQHSIYIQNFIKLYDKWRALIGIRVDSFDVSVSDIVEESRFKQNDTEVSTRFGLVYTPWPALSIFGSYSESVDVNEGLTPSGDPLKPTTSESWEVGFKYINQSLNLDINSSIFHIEQTNVTSDAPDNPGFEIQTARQVSEGLEIDFTLTPGNWMQFNLKYGYTDARFKEDPELPDGTTPINSPFHKLVLMGLFNFTLRNEGDLRAGINFTYKSTQQASIDVEELSIKLPDYWLGNLFLDYAISSKFSLGLEVSNIFDNNYFVGSQGDAQHIVPGPPATVMGRISYRF